MSRRAFLSSGAAAGIATVALGGGAGAARAETGPTNDVDALVLQLAAAAAVFPFHIDALGGEPIDVRLTGPRVTQAWARSSSARTQQGERAAAALIEQGLGGLDTQELLERLSVIVGRASASELDDLNAIVGVAGATLEPKVDPNSEVEPRIWLSTLKIMHENGDRPVAEVAP